MAGGGATLNTISRFGALAIVAICSVALTGFLLGIPVLASVVPGWPRMAPIVMFCFLLSVVGLFALTMPPGQKRFETARRVAAGLVLIISGYFLADYFVTTGLTGGNYSGTVNLLSGRFGRPSPASSFNFLVAAIALLLSRDDRWGQLYSALMTVGLVITGIDFVGYAYGIAALSRGPTISAMSLPMLLELLAAFRQQPAARAHALERRPSHALVRRHLPENSEDRGVKAGRCRRASSRNAVRASASQSSSGENRRRVDRTCRHSPSCGTCD